MVGNVVFSAVWGLFLLVSLLVLPRVYQAGKKEELEGLARGLHQKRSTKKIQKVWERTGRIREKQRMVSGKYIIDINEKDGKAIKVTWNRKNEERKRDDTGRDHGV